MKKILVVDERKRLLDDLYTRLAIDDDLGFEIELDTVTTTDGLASRMAENEYDCILMSADCILRNDYVVDTTLPIYGYAPTQELAKVFETVRIPYVGVLTNPKEVLAVMAKDIDVSIIDVPNTKQTEEEPSYQQSKAYTAPKQQEPSYIPEKKDVPVTEDAFLPNQIDSSILPNGAKSVYIEAEEEEADELSEEQEQFEEEVPMLSSTQSNRTTKTIAVYSPKGGVGKTVISTELAVMLSLTARGRGLCRVCLVDYNVDFGDVTAKLGMERLSADKRRTMYPWAMQIKSRLEKGESPQDIKYTKAEIEQFLQKATDNKSNDFLSSVSKDAELYLLLAPDKHATSWDIDEVHFEIMLTQIIENGGFDFVICDTGNGTRDATIIALKNADRVFFVTTQDKTSINDCARFADCMAEIEKKSGVRVIDRNNVSMIINFAADVSTRGISLQEVEQFLRFPCIAVFENDDSVPLSTNTSMPMVISKTGSSFTKSVERVVNELIDEPFEIQVKKKSFLQRLKERLFKR